MKYHVNDKGIPEICYVIQNCPAAPERDHRDTPRDAMDVFEKNFDPKKAVVSVKPAASAPNVKFSDPKRIQVAANGPAAKKPILFLNATNEGRVNPVTTDGDTLRRLAAGGALILGMRDGSRARTVATSQLFFSSPDGQIGRRVHLTKINPSGVSQIDGLVVLGYRASDGKCYGWIPNKKISFFVLK